MITVVTIEGSCFDYALQVQLVGFPQKLHTRDEEKKVSNLTNQTRRKSDYEQRQRTLYIKHGFHIIYSISTSKLSKQRVSWCFIVTYNIYDHKYLFYYLFKTESNVRMSTTYVNKYIHTQPLWHWPQALALHETSRNHCCILLPPKNGGKDSFLASDFFPRTWKSCFYLLPSVPPTPIPNPQSSLLTNQEPIGQQDISNRTSPYKKE